MPQVSVREVTISVTATWGIVRAPHFPLIAYISFAGMPRYLKVERSLDEEGEELVMYELDDSRLNITSEWKLVDLLTDESLEAFYAMVAGEIAKKDAIDAEIVEASMLDDAVSNQYERN